MGWQDDFGYLNSALRQGYVGSLPRLTQQPYRPRPGSGYDPWAVTRSSSPSWTEFASAPAQVVGATPAVSPLGVRSIARAAPAPTATAPERLNVDLYSGGAPRVARNTKGDFLGSAGEAIGNVVNAVNPFNAIPWLMERVDVAANSLADELGKHTDIPGVGLAAGGASLALHAAAVPFHVFGQAVKGAADAIAPLVEAPLNIYRDYSLNSRVAVYQTILKNGTLDPLAEFALAGSILPFQQTARGNYADYKLYHELLLHTMDPHQQMDLQKRINVILDSIDLPPSVKAALQQDPSADPAKLLDSAPEGRQFSYQAGVPGFTANLGMPLLWYLAVAKGAGTAVNAVRLPAGIGYGDIATAAAGGARGTAAAATAIKVASQATTVAGKMQGIALRTGLVYMPLSLAFDTVARFNGDQGAVDWMDRINRTAIISDKPNVQFLTSFTVNPFEALAFAKKGVIRLASGAGDVTIGRALGARFTRYYTHTDLMATQIQKMYKLGSLDEAHRFIDQNLGGRGEAFDQVVGNALQTVIQRLPEAERSALAALPAVDRIQTALRVHGGEVMRLLEKEPDLLASHWYNDFWLDRQMPGEFNANVAALISRDYRGAVKSTYEARQRLGAVMGRADYIPPRGIEIARGFLDNATDAAGNIPVAGVGGLQDLQRQLPALGKYRQGLLPPGATSVPRTVVEQMLERASQDYATLVKKNPVRAGTATDPILRPNATPHEYAQALGTDQATITELSNHKFGSDQPVDRLRAFVVEKLGMDPQQVAALPADEVWVKASEYVDDTTKPWIEMGQRVAAAQRQIGGVRQELARLHGLPQGMRDRTFADQVVRMEKELGQLTDLVHLATDPPVPFSEWVRAGKRETRAAGASAHQEEMAYRRAQAIDDLERLGAIESAQVVTVATNVGSATPWFELVRPTPINHVSAWAGGASPMSAAFRRRFAEYLRTASEGGTGSMSRGKMDASAYGLLVDMGDHEAWQLFDRHPQALARMTKAQQRFARNADRGTGLDEFSTHYESGAKVGMNQSDAFLEDLTTAIDDRASILQGRSLYNVARTANMKVGPDVYWSEQLATDPSSSRYDPEFTAITHPHNIQRVATILDRPNELYAGLANVVRSDPVMMAALDEMLYNTYATAEDLLRDPSNAAALREVLVPPDFKMPPPGPNPLTPIDDLIVAGDRPAIEGLTDQLLQGRAQGPGPASMPQPIAAKIARAGITRPSHEWRRSLTALEADFNATPADRVLTDPGNRVGLDVLSILAYGVPGREPATIGGTLRLLREIENGNAARMGIGVGLQAEGQRVAREILTEARNLEKRAGLPVEAFRKGIDPAAMAGDDVELARALAKDGILVYNEQDPLGSLQYVFKKPPKSAAVLEWSQVPGLAEEFLASRFEPFESRIGGAQLRQTLGYVFGAHGNEAIGAQVRIGFIDRLGKLGVEPKDAAAIWNRWRDIARGSRETEVRRRPGVVTGVSLREHLPADNPLYADVRNIPTRKLDHDAQVALGLTHDPIAQPGINIADYDPAYVELLRSIDYGTTFREASSPVRQWLKGAAAGEEVKMGRVSLGAAPVPASMGRALAGAYGLVAHNKAVTTMYYWFRFALDARYHAMNYLEAQFLYLGRAGLKNGEIATGYMGQSERYLRHLDEDFANNTGYATSRARFAMAYKTFLKEQPGVLRGKLGTLEQHDPNLMHQALSEIAHRDPQIADLIAHAGETPQTYLKALDQWHGKLLSASSVDEAATAIDEAIAPALQETPALAEIYGRLADANKELWTNVRETFYGNPNRSRAERFLNSYLLFWPLSYQIKATKWLLGVMYDRAGGVKTNAVGAYALTQFAQDHQRLLATDPEYQQWFEKHKTLVFMAQMLAPITPDSMGVSLNPILRDLFFERTRAPWEIGPIYTATLIPKLANEVLTDLYPTLGDAPGFDAIYRLTGAGNKTTTHYVPPPVKPGTLPPPPPKKQPDPWQFKQLNTPPPPTQP